MMIDLPYVFRRGDNLRYRRKVPKPLQPAIGKQEIIFGLGKEDAGFLKRYQAAHKEAEKQLAAATRGAAATKNVETDLEQFRAAEKQLRKWKLDPEWNVEELDPEDDDTFDDRELIARARRMQDLLAKYPKDADGRPIGASGADLSMLQVLGLGAAAQAPEPTLEDAKAFYLKEKVVGTPDEHKKTLRVNRVVGHVQAALGRKNPTLASVTKIDAIEVRDHIVGVVKSPATAKRYLNDLKAIFGSAIDAYGLSLKVANPFLKVAVKTDGVSREAREVFSPDQLAKTRRRVLSSANPDLQRIWRLLEATGCRLAEITGLMVKDVDLSHQRPHLDLVVHPHRRLKTKGSVRVVPLLGDALAAAREAVEAAGSGAYLFEPYHARKGADAASAALMKHVRIVVADKRVTVHSLRHNMADNLKRAGVSTNDEYLVLGRLKGDSGEDYGGKEGRLEFAERALKKALGAS